MCEPPPPFGPVYNVDSPLLRKLRRGDDRKAHGAAVLAVVLSSQRQALQRELPEHRISCASGTSHSTGKSILKSIAGAQRAALQAAAAAERRSRSPAYWESAYEAAMAAKRRRQAAPPIALVREPEHV